MPDDLVSRCRFIEDHCETYPVKRLCQVLDVARSRFYKWRQGRAARAGRERADQALAEKIKAVHDDSDGTYGSPRVTAELRDDGALVNERRVARVMRKFNIVGVHLRKKVRTTVPEPAGQVVPDLFQRDFTAPEPGVKYMGDITYLPVGDGEFLYLATVLDCSAAGWPAGPSPTTCAPSSSPTPSRLPQQPCHPVHGGRRCQRGQRRLRKLPRVVEARNTAGRTSLRRRTCVDLN